MIQFCEALQLDPNQLADIISNNMNNPILQPLIKDSSFLSKIQLQLTRVDQTQFFIKHVFKMVREPKDRQMKVLEAYHAESENNSLRDLAAKLLFEFGGQNKLSVLEVLREIRKSICDKNTIQFHKAIKTKLDIQFLPFVQLIQVLIEKKQNDRWTVQAYRKKVSQYALAAFKNLSKYAEIEDIFLSIFQIILIENMQQQSKSQVLITLFLFNLCSVQPSYTSKLIQGIHRNSYNSNRVLPNLFISESLFTLFATIFEGQTYFDQSLQINLNSISKIASDFYTLLSPVIPSVQLGWITIFALDKLMCKQFFQESLHVCASLLREVWYFRSEIISEILCFVISNYVQKITVAQNIMYLQSILLMLTPAQLKYVIFRLNSLLSEDKKQQIIVQSNKHPNKSLSHCALYFIKLSNLKEHIKQNSEISQKLKQEYIQLHDEIETSRYNSYQKQLGHFIKYNMFILSHQISMLQLGSKHRLITLLRYYKNLIKNDYFSEQFWINQEKNIVFSLAEDSDKEKISIICQFLQQQKINNLSGMILIQIFMRKALRSQCSQIQNFIQMLKRYTELALNVIQNDVFASNLVIALEFLLLFFKYRINVKVNVQKLLQLLTTKRWKQICSKDHYSRLNFSIQMLIIYCLQVQKKLKKINEFAQNLDFYRVHNQKRNGYMFSNEYTQRIIQFYETKDIKLQFNFNLRQLQTQTALKVLMCEGLNSQSLKQVLKQTFNCFIFESPIFKEQIVSLTYLAESPEDNHYFKNHFIPFLSQEYLKVYASAVEKLKQQTIINELYSLAFELLREVLEGDTFSHNINFYRSLVKSQNVYILLTNQVLQQLDFSLIQKIFKVCLSIIEKDNYPLLRQYIEIVLCRSYIVLNKKYPKNNFRKQLMALIKVNINIGVPVALTLGYELIDCSMHPQNYRQSIEEICAIHQELIKFISCHTAYLRAICQYYIYRYLQIIQPNDPFLSNIKHFWSQDKDSQKILKNVAMVVEGFREGVQNKCDFLGFERVEEYPSNRVKLQFYRTIARFYGQFVVGEISMNGSANFYQAYCKAIDQRYEFIKSEYISLVELHKNYPKQRQLKSNMRSKIRQQKKIEVPIQHKKKNNKRKEKGKQKGREKQLATVQPTQQTEVIVQQNSLITSLQKEYDIFSGLIVNAAWYRKKIEPSIIIIATLLEKVHNFGHILRTVNGKNAMLVVPSNIPLQHPQCKSLVPPFCDVQIVEIKKRDLQMFIFLMKNLGYPLVALEQCSRSVKVQEAIFPKQYMLLLGNERLGAPSSYLNEADLLVQIPQVGKVRSLNVHVSMVICLWESLCQSKGKM